MRATRRNWKSHHLMKMKCIKRCYLTCFPAGRREGGWKRLHFLWKATTSFPIQCLLEFLTQCEVCLGFRCKENLKIVDALPVTLVALSLMNHFTFTKSLALPQTLTGEVQSLGKWPSMSILDWVGLSEFIS